MGENTGRMEDMDIETMRENIIAKYGEGGNEVPVEQVEETVAPAEGVPSAENDGAEGVEASTAPAQEQTPVQNAPSFEEAMQFAQIRDENARLSSEVENLRNQLAQSQAMANHNAQAANQAIAEQLNGNGGMPELDVDAFLYADESERIRMKDEYDKKLIEYAAKQATAEMLGKISPLMQQYDTAVADRQMSEALDELAAMEGWSDVKDHSDAIRKLSAQPEFANMPINQRMAIAALIDKGMRASAPQPTPVTPDINAQADAILANPELMKIITMRNVKDVQEKNANVPTHIAGGGFGNAAFKTSKRPATMEEIIREEGGYY